MRRCIPRVAALAALLTGVMLVIVPAWAATKTVKLTVDNQFQPGTFEVAVGDTVNFVWEGGFHDVKFADGVSSGAPVGDVGTSFARTFDAAGTFAYVCTVHEALGMAGTITVAAQASGDAGTGGGGAGTLPLTGPEESLLPLGGLALMIVGVVVLLRLRRTRVNG